MAKAFNMAYYFSNILNDIQCHDGFKIIRLGGYLSLMWQHAPQCIAN
ncbi:hypothetical protein [Erwinia aphidicola]|uniref:Uncharacterized protein n=1 Tax=Erwinia aphidicola TaxID=68334 RepID=A0ABU8DBS9_ERWAP